MNDIFMCYAHHQQTIEDFIEGLAATDTPNNSSTQYAVAAHVGLDIKSLSNADIQYIEREVEKRW